MKKEAMTIMIYCTGVEHRFRVKEAYTPRIGTLPFPEGLIITPVAESDLNVFRDNWSGLVGKVIFGDKAYQDKVMQDNMLFVWSEILSPVKHPRGVAENVKQFFKPVDLHFYHN